MFEGTAEESGSSWRGACPGHSMSKASHGHRMTSNPALSLRLVSTCPAVGQLQPHGGTSQGGSINQTAEPDQRASLLPQSPTLSPAGGFSGTPREPRSGSRGLGSRVIRPPCQHPPAYLKASHEPLNPPLPNPGVSQAAGHFLKTPSDRCPGLSAQAEVPWPGQHVFPPPWAQGSGFPCLGSAATGPWAQRPQDLA